MAGPSFSASDAAAAFTDAAVSVIADINRDEAPWYDGVFDVGPIDAISNPKYGDKSTTIVFGTGMDEVAYGQNVNYTSGKRGYTPQGALIPLKKGISIPMQDLEANRGMDRAIDLVTEFVRVQQRWWINFKNARVARMLTHGSLTAGDRTAFQASFLDNAATFDGLCYDGVSLFNAAHPLKAPNGTTTTFDNHLASTALSATNFDTAFQTMSVTNAIDETGERIDITPRYLLGAANLRQTMFGITNTQNVPGTANMEDNVNRGIVQHRVVKQLTDSTWFLVGAPESVRIRDSGPLRVRSWLNNESNSMSFEVSGEFLAYPRDARHLLAANTATS